METAEKSGKICKNLPGFENFPAYHKFFLYTLEVLCDTFLVSSASFYNLNMRFSWPSLRLILPFILLVFIVSIVWLSFPVVLSIYHSLRVELKAIGFWGFPVTGSFSFSMMYWRIFVYVLLPDVLCSMLLIYGLGMKWSLLYIAIVLSSSLL